MTLLNSIKSAFLSTQAAAAAPVVEEVVIAPVVTEPLFLSKNEMILSVRNEGVREQIKEAEHALEKQEAENKAMVKVLAESTKLAKQVPVIRGKLLKAFEAQAVLELEMEEAMLAFKDLGL